MSLVVTSKVKASVKKNKMNTASDFVPALDRHIAEIINRAAGRAGANGRKTVRASDLYGFRF